MRLTNLDLRCMGAMRSMHGASLLLRKRREIILLPRFFVDPSREEPAEKEAGLVLERYNFHSRLTFVHHPYTSFRHVPRGHCTVQVLAYASVWDCHTGAYNVDGRRTKVALNRPGTNVAKRDAWVFDGEGTEEHERGCLCCAVERSCWRRNESCERGNEVDRWCGRGVLQERNKGECGREGPNKVAVNGLLRYGLGMLNPFHRRVDDSVR